MALSIDSLSDRSQTIEDEDEEMVLTSSVDSSNIAVSRASKITLNPDVAKRRDNSNPIPLMHQSQEMSFVP